MTHKITTAAAILALSAGAAVSAANSNNNATAQRGGPFEDYNNSQPIDESSACAADINGDGMVEVHDLMYVLGNWSFCLSGDPDACISDVNHDGRVGVEDLVAVIEAWGTVCPTAGG